MHHLIEDVSAKTEEYPRTYPQFSNLMSTTKKTFVSIYLKMRVCLAIDTEHGTRLFVYKVIPENNEK